MSRFGSFTQTNGTDNRFRGWYDTENEIEIIVGGTSTHTFFLPFKYSDYVSDCKLLYKQGLDTVLEKQQDTFSLTELPNGHTVLQVELSPQETDLFGRFLLDTSVQLKIITLDNLTVYNQPRKVKITLPIADIGTEGN